MGRLLFIHQCAVCNYYVEGELHYGWSGISTQFLRNHYALATCQNCQNVVSALVPTPLEDINGVITAARRALVQMEADAIIGDEDARNMLPFFKEALDTFDENMPGSIGQCDVCGSFDLKLHEDLDPEQFDAQDAWLPCPRCAEGQLLIETVGEWT